MSAQVEVLYRSPFGRIVDFRCRNTQPGTGKPEYIESFSVNFTRRGNFGYRVGREAFDIHSGVILLEKAGSERVVSHHHATKDECTAVELTPEFSEEVREHWALSGRLKRCGRVCTGEVSASVLPATPRLDYLHSILFNAARRCGPGSLLKVDVLLLDLLDEIGASGGLASRRPPEEIDVTLKDRHLDAIDRAKSFINANFQQELALSEIARHAHVSVFHFSRLFKRFTSRSPYQYLIEVRLKHAALLLRHTSLSVTEVCFESGFNSFEHFIATFTRRYSGSPTKYRSGRERASGFVTPKSKIP